MGLINFKKNCESYRLVSFLQEGISHFGGNRYTT